MPLNRERTRFLPDEAGLGSKPFSRNSDSSAARKVLMSADLRSDTFKQTSNKIVCACHRACWVVLGVTHANEVTAMRCSSDVRNSSNRRSASANCLTLNASSDCGFCLMNRLGKVLRELHGIIFLSPIALRYSYRKRNGERIFVRIAREVNLRAL